MKCPWDAFAPANLTFCERSLCGWITQPANSWSNVAFLAVGVFVLVRARKEGRRVAGWLGWIAILTGLASTALHATSTLVGQLTDQTVMFFESAFFITFNVARWRRWPRWQLGLLYAGVVAGSVVTLLFHQTWGAALFAAHAVVFLAIELRLFLAGRGAGAATRYGALAAAGATFAVSWGVWWLDFRRVLCDPDNHVFTGHAAWHLLGAISFFFWYRFYGQFDGARPPPA